MKKETLKLLLKEIVKMLKKESMFPKEFDRHSSGSCMAAAELATKYLLSRGIKDFKIVEGWVAFSDDWDIEKRGDKYYEGGDVYSHTWIEFKNGRIFDPTKKQWRNMGYNPDEAKIVKVKTDYTPEEYLETCEWEPSPWEKFKKSPVNETHEYDKAKIKMIQSRLPYIKDENLYLTVQKLPEFPDYDWIQVDEFSDGKNHFSSNPDDMIKLGYDMPSQKELLAKLPQGRYNLAVVKKEMGKMTENMTYDQLLKLTASTPRSPDDNTNRLDRAKNVRARSIPVSVEEGQEQWNFRYKSNPSVTNTPFEGQITFLKGDVERKDDAMELECKVDCGCPDYRYKFAYNNYKQGAGDIGPDTLNKCINRAPQHAYDIGEGLCKHLAALRGYLQTKISSTRKSNLFEAISEVAKQGPFNITYYD